MFHGFVRKTTSFSKNKSFSTLKVKRGFFLLAPIITSNMGDLCFYDFYCGLKDHNKIIKC